MKRYSSLVLCIVSLAISLLFCGCVERMLTIYTQPPGAMVVLNDEQIGQSPVTVSFNWYGDYCVRIKKEGYETLDTHRKLKGPWYDSFPFDLFAQIFYPGRIVDDYEWTFELAEQKQPTREKLISEAEALKKQLDQDN